MNLGRFGESLACSYLMEKGYSIKERNYFTDFGEIDIIAQLNSLLVFVEVKTRIGLDAGYPYEAITEKKLKTIRKVGWFYLKCTKPPPMQLRIDVLSITLLRNYQIKNIEHFENVFL